MPVTVSNNTGTLKIDDGNSVMYPKKSKVYVETNGNFVIVGWDNVHYVNQLYTNFTSPSGASASAVAASIAAFLNT